MLTELFFFLVAIVLALLFWQRRQLSELAQRLAAHACSKQNLQLLSLARLSARPCFTGNGLSWKVTYSLDFSTDGLNRFQATLYMRGAQSYKVDWPVFPEPQWQHAPRAKVPRGCGCA